MKQIITIITGGLLIVIAVVFGFTLNQANQERLSLTADLQYRTHVLADSLKESIEPYYINNSTTTLGKIVNKFADNEHLVGLAVYDSKGESVVVSTDLSSSTPLQTNAVTIAMDSDKATGEYVNGTNTSMYVFVEPLHEDSRVIGAFMVVQNAGYIDLNVQRVWESNLLRLFIQVVLFLIIIGLIVWLVIVRPLFAIVESVRSARTGNGTQPPRFTGHSFFSPLTNEVAKMAKSLFEARSAASEEARMRLEKLDTPWTSERLKEFIKGNLKDRSIFIVSNREPYEHRHSKGGIQWTMPASGMVTAMESVMEACGGMWIAHGSGDADREVVDEHDKVLVPPDDPRYTLKRVWLSGEEVAGYYVGFANEALWPLCHMAHVRPTFRKEDWAEYQRVNEKFANSLLEEIKSTRRPLILLQDYHFALLPELIKRARPDAQVCLFWHIPWPSAESFSICPWRKELLKGMLGADLLGFHTQLFCNNFMETVGKEMEALIDLEQFSITRENHPTLIKPFPISIAFTNDETTSPHPLDRSLLEKLHISTEYIGLGIDRLDYSKGILERFRGVEFFLDAYPEYQERFTFLQIAPLSREAVEKYRQYAEEVTAEAERVNKKFAKGDWQPIVLQKSHYTHDQLDMLSRLANVCLVTSLHDGMNLVAKEYVAARNDERGVLVLSSFTGAARDLKGAVLVNPYSAEQLAEAIRAALTMAPHEQQQRMQSMRSSIKNFNIYRWSAELIKTVSTLG